jgi:RNA ligase (TIGR02306 family)
MSTHSAIVVPIKLEVHPNADSLSIVRVGEFQCVVRTSDWIGRDRGCYIEPDTIVDCSKPEFSFLGNGSVVVRAKRLRGAWSMGLLVPTDKEIGQDLWNDLGLAHYEPVEDLFVASDCNKTPQEYRDLPKYDIENGRKLDVSREFANGEPVFATEKIHGSNMSVVFHDGEIKVHSRTQWPKDEPGNIFWEALRKVPQIESFCRENPGYFVYGEAYGKVKKFHYDANPIMFRCFDIRRPDRNFLDVDDMLNICARYQIPTVPARYVGEFNLEHLLRLAEEKSVIGGPVQEGIVVKPLKERRSVSGNRVIMKIINPAYLEMK